MNSSILDSITLNPQENEIMLVDSHDLYIEENSHYTDLIYDYDIEDEIYFYCAGESDVCSIIVDRLLHGLLDRSLTVYKLNPDKSGYGYVFSYGNFFSLFIEDKLFLEKDCVYITAEIDERLDGETTQDAIVVISKEHYLRLNNKL